MTENVAHNGFAVVEIIGKRYEFSLVRTARSNMCSFMLYSLYVCEGMHLIFCCCALLLAQSCLLIAFHDYHFVYFLLLDQ